MARWDIDTSYFKGSVASFVFFLILTRILSPWISASLSEVYKKLSPAGKVDWNSRVASTIHALLVASLCIYILLFDYPIMKDRIWGESALVKTNCAIVVGYMLADLFMMLLYYSYIGEIFYVFHHAATITPYVFVMVYGIFSYFGNFRLIAELSTPFINCRWFFDVLGMKTSKLYMANGLIMAFVFFIVRIVSIPPYYYRIYEVYGTEDYSATRWGHYMLVFPCLTLDVINLYWFYKLFLGCKKVLKNFMNSNNKTPVRKEE